MGSATTHTLPAAAIKGNGNGSGRLGVPMSAFAEDITLSKYAHTKASGHKETWPEIAHRQAYHVVRPYLPHLEDRIRARIEARQLIPGGRYLYAAGRKHHYCQNCYLYNVEDTTEDWGRLMGDATLSLMSGGGVGVVYSKLRAEGRPLGSKGGESTGPCALMKMVNEAARYIIQGGNRRSAIWAGLHWNHPDVFKFIHIKRMNPLVKKCCEQDFTFPVPMNMTNVSVILDTKFFDAFGNEAHPDHKLACKVYWESVRSMTETGEPGFSVDTGDNEDQSLRNAPVHGDTRVLTDKGYVPVAEIVGVPSVVWTGKQWAPNVMFRKTGDGVQTVKVKMTGGREIVCDPEHPFLVNRYQGAGKNRRLVQTERVPAGDLEEGDAIAVSLPMPELDGTVIPEAYTLGFVHGDGSFHIRPWNDIGRHQEVGASLTICTHAKEACTVNFPERLIRTRKPNRFGCSSFTFHTDSVFLKRHKQLTPDAPSPEWAASYLAGLFDADGYCHLPQKRISLSTKHLALADGVVRMLESLGILAGVSQDGPTGYGSAGCWRATVMADSVRRFLTVIPTVRVRCDIPDDWKPYRESLVKVLSVEEDEPADVYCADVKVEEHSFQAEGVLVGNCCEVTSKYNRDMCNLLSINLSRIRTLEDFRDCVELGTAFLVCGTLYSQLPIQEMYQVREKTRRLGLGLMGVHEWLMKRGRPYGPDDELGKWLEVYTLSTQYANAYADRLSISRPVATRAIAPTGTISIVGETTSGIEPVFATAYKRRYLKGQEWCAQYVVDATARKMVEMGMNPMKIETALDLAEDTDRRVGFQAWVQGFTDMSISSTLNIPEWGSSINNESTVDKFGKDLMKHLPNVRGMTAYPNGARGGQPLVATPYWDAIHRVGVEFKDHSEETCKSGVCGS